MTILHTASYRAYRPEMGLPVVASLGLPKWRPEAADWVRCWLITPRWAYFKQPDFADQYRAQLERYGSRKIAAVLESIAREHQAETLVLLCHEVSWADCHRRQFADWLLATTGELCTETM